MIGGELALDRITQRCNFHSADYSEVDYRETRHVPGVQVTLEAHLFVLLEWAFVQLHVPSGSDVLDSSLNVTNHGKA